MIPKKIQDIEKELSSPSRLCAEHSNSTFSNNKTKPDGTDSFKDKATSQKPDCDILLPQCEESSSSETDNKSPSIFCDTKLPSCENDSKINFDETDSAAKKNIENVTELVMSDNSDDGNRSQSSSGLLTLMSSYNDSDSGSDVS